MPPARTIVSTCIAAGALLSPQAHAALTENLAVSPVAMSLGNAVTADPPGLDSIHFNPAGLARITSDTRSDTVFGAMLRTTADFHQPVGFDVGGFTEDPLNGTHSDHNKQAIFIPIAGVPSPRLPFAAAAGLALSWHNEGSPWTFATGTYVPQAVGIDRTKNPNDPARFDGKQVVIQRLVYLSPSVGYKVNDQFQLGLAIPIAHQGFALDTEMRFPNKLLGIIGKLQDAWCGPSGNPLDELGFGLCGTDSTGKQSGRLRPFESIGEMRFAGTAPADVTFNVGALWQPSDRLGFGAVYQSGSKTVITGDYNFHANPMLPEFVRHMYNSLWGPVVAAMFGFPTSIPTDQGGSFTLVMPYPAHLQLGLKAKPIDGVQFNVDAGWTDWSKWNQMTFQFDRSVNLLEMARLFGQADSTKLIIPRGYRSVWSYGYGLQLDVWDGLKLRMGYEPRKSSVPTNKIDLIAPMPNLPVKSIGFSYETKDGMKLETGFSYARGRYNVPANTDCNLNCTDFFNVIYNPYAGLDVSGTLVLRYFGMKITQPF
ncbi:MAG: outer membrane protein transport protein [Burkholderiales bacterium]|nr:outer membrane protein transport protein [Burkholderiales bacterium]